MLRETTSRDLCGLVCPSRTKGLRDLVVRRIVVLEVFGTWRKRPNKDPVNRCASAATPRT